MLGVVSGMVSQRFLLQVYGENEKIKNFSALPKARKCVNCDSLNDKSQHAEETGTHRAGQSRRIVS